MSVSTICPVCGRAMGGRGLRWFGRTQICSTECFSVLCEDEAKTLLESFPVANVADLDCEESFVYRCDFHQDAMDLSEAAIRMGGMEEMSELEDAYLTING